MLTLGCNEQNIEEGKNCGQLWRFIGPRLLLVPFGEIGTNTSFDHTSRSSIEQCVISTSNGILPQALLFFLSCAGVRSDGLDIYGGRDQYAVSKS